MIQPRPSSAPIATVRQPVQSERLGTPSTAWDVALVAFGVPGAMVTAALTTSLVMASTRGNPLLAATELATAVTVYAGTMLVLGAGSVAARQP
jgi:hypothetical protein